MGSGSRFTYGWNQDTLGLGFYISRFPFELSIYIVFLFWNLSIGFGKGYDAVK